MPTTISTDALRCLPVFPLPRLVLFPGTRLPLRVFEPSHRAMLQACIEQPEPWVVIAHLKPHQPQRDDDDPEPPFFRIGGLGYVRNHRVYDDGSFDIEIAATARVHLTQLPKAGLSYPRGHGLLLPDASDRVDQTELSALLSIAFSIARDLQRAQSGFKLQMPMAGAGPGAIADQIADQLVLDPLSRQAILETLDVSARIRCVITHLARLHMALNGESGMHLATH